MVAPGKGAFVLSSITWPERIILPAFVFAGGAESVFAGFSCENEINGTSSVSRSHTLTAFVIIFVLVINNKAGQTGTRNHYLPLTPCLRRNCSQQFRLLF